MDMKVVIGCLFLGLLAACQREGEETGAELESVGYAMTVADFHRAAGMGEVEVMSTMIEEGVDLLGEVEGDTALHLAARAGREESLGFLLLRGIPIDAVGGQGRSPLMSAAEANEVVAVKFLLESGADPALRDDLGYRALTLAAEGGCAEVVETLANRSRENVDDALFLAALRGHAETVEVLASSGASVYARMEDSRTALMMAAREGHEEVVAVLLKYGANRYAIDVEGLTAGQMAMGAGQLEVGELLLAPPEEEEFSFSEILELAEVDLLEVNVAGDDLALGSGEDGGDRPRESVVSTDPATGVSPEEGVFVRSEGRGVGAPMTDPLERPGSRPPAVEMREYHERPLPLRVEGVEGKSVRLRFLYGENKKVTVREGEEIPFTRLRVVSVQERRRRTKESGNDYADVSAVLIEDPRTGLQRELVTQIAASAHEPFAVVSSREGANQIARSGALIQNSEGESYRVLDVRPTQVVLENLTTGEVETVHLARRK